MFKVVSLFSGCGGADQGIIGDFVFNNLLFEWRNSEPKFFIFHI